MGNDLLKNLKAAEIMGSKKIMYSPTCDNICDDFCNDCSGRAAMELKPYKVPEKEIN
ncbi:MAG: hypothetical protein NTZ83_02410 [Candidatus Pacearchaeota archaeon]|nr:hypothetical protein [Candidatus Pacearchaeota archaeon]